MKWIEVQIKTTTQAEEAVTNILYEVGVGGLAIEDPNDILTLVQNEDKENYDYIDPDLLKQDFEGVIIKGYFEESEDLIDKIELIKQNVEKIPQYNLDKGLGEVTVTEVYEKDWMDGWKKYYKPKRVGKRIVVKPSWEDYKKKDNDIVIQLDPGMAFGTGTHETTIMCIRKLEEYIKKEDVVFDVGCGSGILSIVSAKLGASKVKGIDLDKICVEVANKNVRINNVQDIVEIENGDLLSTVKQKADLIVANIVAEVIVQLTKDIKTFLKEDGIFISSGIIKEKVKLVQEDLKEQGFEIIETYTVNGWTSIVSKLRQGISNE